MPERGWNLSLTIISEAQIGVVVVRRIKPSHKGSPVFEKINLERLKNCSEMAQRSEELLESAKRQLDKSRELMDSSLSKKPLATP